MTAQLCLAAGGLYGATGVMLGAFGAHALKQHLSEAAQSTWETAVLYQLLHAVALLVLGVWQRGLGTAVASLELAGWAFLIGVLLFSGSLYVLALGGPRVLGPVTPLGGVAFILGWLAVIVAAFQTAR